MRITAAIALGILFLASVAAAPPPPVPRPQCCHGCDMYSCTKEQCGKTCKLGPKCDKCWKKDCTANH